MNDVYLQEYSAPEAVRRYTSKAAGYGIDYLLQHDYADVYLDSIEKMLQIPRQVPLRILEFGCGGGMNIIALLTLLERNGREVEAAIGADFSDVLIHAAREESRRQLKREQQQRVSFVVARNERLSEDIAKETGRSRSALQDHFHVILGVNTFRYCHRLGKQKDCAHQIAALLAPGGVCVMIDMNRNFPLFRSKMRSRRGVPDIQTYLPTLEEYTTPFSDAGLEVLKSTHFCWIPHSAGPRLLTMSRALTPILNVVARPMAMRSLVISRKKQN
jgi:SAM-dependent methyltransferase